MAGLFKTILVAFATCFLVAGAQLSETELDPTNRHEVEKYTEEVNMIGDAFQSTDLLAGLRMLSSERVEEYEDDEIPESMNVTDFIDTNSTSATSDVAQDVDDPQLLGFGDLMNKWRGGSTTSTTAAPSGGFLERLLGWGKPKTWAEKMKQKLMQQAVEMLDDNCTRQLGKLMFALQRREKYAIRVIDAMGKPPAAILGGDVLWLGSYDECRNITAGPPQVNEPFQGQYCRAKLTMEAKSMGQNVSIVYGVCMPDTCPEDKVSYFLNQIFTKAKITGVTVSDPVCPDRKEKLSHGDMGMLTVMSVMALTVLIGTIYDAICRIVEKSMTEAAEERRQNLSNTKERTQVRASRGYSFSNPDQILVHNDEVAIEFARIESRARTLTLVDEGSGCISVCKRVCNDILMSFSVIRNGERLLSTTRASDELKCLDGLRVLSCNWVVLGHTYAMILIYITNPLNFLETLKSFVFQPIMNTALSVETFLVMGGLLVTYWTLKKLNTTGSNLTMAFAFFAHRLWRVVPVYMFTLMLWTNLIPHIPAGPLMDKIHTNARMASCSKYWWTNALFINNFLPNDPMKSCMGWTWYLADDMQFYILSPLFIFILYRSWKIGTIIMVPIIIAGTVLTGMVARTYEVETPKIMDTLNQARAGGGSSSEEWGHLFVRPYHRIGAYLVGILLGYILFIVKGRVHINKFLVVFLWLAALAMSMVCAYGLYGHYQLGVALPLTMSTGYIALSRFIFALCIMWIIFACQTGNGGPIHSILSWRGWRPLSRLTFLVYLVHPMIINITYTSTHNPMHFDPVSMTYLFIGHLVLSYVAAFGLHLLIEGPTISIGRMCRKYWNDRVRQKEDKEMRSRVGSGVPSVNASNC